MAGIQREIAPLPKEDGNPLVLSLIDVCRGKKPCTYRIDGSRAFVMEFLVGGSYRVRLLKSYEQLKALKAHFVAVYPMGCGKLWSVKEYHGGPMTVSFRVTKTYWDASRDAYTTCELRFLTVGVEVNKNLNFLSFHCGGACGGVRNRTGPTFSLHFNWDYQGRVQQPPKTIARLPCEALGMIFSFLPIQEVLKTIPAVCESFRLAVANTEVTVSTISNEGNGAIRDCDKCLIRALAKTVKPSTATTLSWTFEHLEEVSGFDVKALLAMARDNLVHAKIHWNHRCMKCGEDILPLVYRFLWETPLLEKLDLSPRYGEDPDERFPWLPKLLSLRMVNEDRPFDDTFDEGMMEGKEFFELYKSLTELLVGFVPDTFWQTVPAVALPSFQTLLVGCPENAPLALFTNLTTLHLHSVNPRELPGIGSALQNHHYLENLCIRVKQVVRGLQHFTSFFEPFLSQFPRGLLVLALDCPWFSDEYCRLLAERCPMLRSVCIHAQGVSSDGVAAFDLCTRLKRLTLVRNLYEGDIFRRDGPVPRSTDAPFDDYGVGIPGRLRGNHHEFQSYLSKLFRFVP